MPKNATINFIHVDWHMYLSYICYTVYTVRVTCLYTVPQPYPRHLLIPRSKTNIPIIIIYEPVREVTQKHVLRPIISIISDDFDGLSRISPYVMYTHVRISPTSYTIMP